MRSPGLSPRPTVSRDLRYAGVCTALTQSPKCGWSDRDEAESNHLAQDTVVYRSIFHIALAQPRLPTGPHSSKAFRVLVSPGDFTQGLKAGLESVEALLCIVCEQRLKD